MQNNNGKSQQWLAALTVNLLSISSGIAAAWPSPVIPQLRSNNPPVGNVPMSENQTSWIAGLLPIGSLAIIPFCGLLAESVGRRNFAFLTGLPHIVSWLLIIYARDYVYLYAARFCSGVGGAMTLFIVPMYIGEIACKDIRGMLGYLFSLCLSTGILFSYVAGAFLSYRLFAILCLVFPVVFVFAICFLPDTPVYLARKKRHIEAHKSLVFFRNKNYSLVDQELAKLRQQLKAFNNSSKLSFCYFFSDRATRRGLIISTGLLAGQQFSGIAAMLTYAETIFQLASSSISSKTAPIIIGVILMVGDYVSTMLIDRAGRRPLALISCFGMAVSHALVGGFFYLQQYEYDVGTISWLPVVALSTYTITYVLGMSGVPCVVISEVFRSDISSFAMTACLTFCYVTTLASIKIFDLAMRYVSASGCFFMHASFCVASFVFTYCMLPETKGRTREDIVDELAGIAKSNRSERKASERSMDGIDTSLVTAI